jgi:hypothetical protein
MQKYFGSGNKRRHCSLSSLEAALVALRRQAMSEFNRDDGVSRPSGLMWTTMTRPIIISSVLGAALLARPFPETIVAGRPIANILPTSGMHPVAIAIPLVATVYLVVAFWVTFAGSELSLILAVATLIVIMLLGLITACGAFARNVEPDGTRTRSFREFLNGEVDVETGRISGRVALWQIATMPVVVAIGGTLLACAAATLG